MSLNTAHINGGVLIHAGECILLFSEDVSMEFSGQDSAVFKGNKTGRLYLTTHRMIFNNAKQADPMISFSFPFITLSDVELEQPVFGANYIKGKVRAQPNGNWIGEAKFKLVFKKGGAIDFAQAMLKAASMASRNATSDAPPPYTPPGQWYQAPPPAYAPDPTGYYGWVPPVNVFSMQPPANSVYMTDMPPPYPGINNTNGFVYPPHMQQATGFTQPNAAGDAKATEAAQSAYFDPTNPHSAYVPPPAYYEPPPAYHEANKKNQ
ncbi:WW domain-binding protein 2 isoform X2 [Halyomorpha halys]|uniref:WW domain-binding protein 2 isoform X2 n=1 Tax=Halyomorpha halys TaxID=286706 RepID=UPI0006D526AC|nr:WW domain-binding protein 2 isoform X2 [Halyomorpha halys]